MKLMDKIKNALFEVEYVEVEDQPKKEKPKKIKERRYNEEEEKPIAKKVVLPGREEKIEELQEEELKDEDFEIRPKEEVIKEKPHEEFKIMNDHDFMVDDDIPIEEPEIVELLENEDVPRTTERRSDREHDLEFPMEDDDVRPEPYSNHAYGQERESHPYGMDSSYNVPVREYGGYEKREEKTYFKPSPIISPIYGILDKNYKKEDLKEKKEIRITSYNRGNVSVDDVRDKAYGEKKEELEGDNKFEVDEADDENLLVDLSDRAKPEVKEITVGDAVEYFQDLGLEYNVDYVDASKEKASKLEEKNEEVKEELEEAIPPEAKHAEVEETPQEEPILEEMKEELEDEKKTEDEIDNKEVLEEKKEEKGNVEDEDNLFDLIDSMYQEKE